MDAAEKNAARFNLTRADLSSRRRWIQETSREVIRLPIHVVLPAFLFMMCIRACTPRGHSRSATLADRCGAVYVMNAMRRATANASGSASLRGPDKQLHAASLSPGISASCGIVVTRVAWEARLPSGTICVRSRLPTNKWNILLTRTPPRAFQQAAAAQHICAIGWCGLSNQVSKATSCRSAQRHSDYFFVGAGGQDVGGAQSAAAGRAAIADTEAQLGHQRGERVLHRRAGRRAAADDEVRVVAGRPLWPTCRPGAH